MVIAEDSVLLREGITRLLAEYDAEVVAALADASRLLAAVIEHDPDLVIVDVSRRASRPSCWAAALSVWRRGEAHHVDPDQARVPISDTEHRRVLAVLTYLRSP